MPVIRSGQAEYLSPALYFFDKNIFNNYIRILIGPQHEKTCLQWLANNKGADQPVHPPSLISAFVIRLLESAIYKIARSEIPIF